MFQADYPKFSELKIETEALIKTLALNFMTRSYVQPIPTNQINPHQIEEHVDLKQVYLGFNATNLLADLANTAEQNDVEKISEAAKMFYIEAIVQIKKKKNYISGCTR